MGGKGASKPKVQVTEYRMSIHHGVCIGGSRVDHLRSIRIGDKIAWSGVAQGPTDILVNKTSLFGGIKKEGGVYGSAYFLPGEDDQLMPTRIASKYGLTQNEMPAYRGLASVYFLERSGQRRGFYWGANTPYLRETKIGIACISEGLDQSIVRVPRAGSIQSSETVNLSASANAGATHAAGIAAGKVVSAGIGDVLKLTLPSGGTYVAWSPWGDPSPANPGSGGSSSGSANFFYVARNGDAGDTTLMGDTEIYDGYEAARAAFVPGYIAGASSYTLYIVDDPIGDNSGGLSVKVDKYSEWDVNPAHIIYEALVNTQWGMGAAPAGIDKPAFEAAAVTLFEENFGLSLIWTQQTSIEDFIKEIIDHIEATIYIDPRTGLLTIKLIRNDYNIVDLPVFDSTNSTVKNFKRKLFGETTNEITVSWTDPRNEEKRTVTVQDIANIAIQGRPVPAKRDYYGIRTAEKATEVAWRDLRVASATVASCELEVDRSAWSLTPGDVCVVESPEDEVVSIVMRVGPIDYGKTKDAKIKVSLAEDVFALDKAEYASPGDGEWVDQAEEPEPMEYSFGFTLPYYIAVNTLPPGVLTDTAYPTVFAGILGAQLGDDTEEFDVWGDVTNPAGGTYEDLLGTLSIVSRSVLDAALPVEATSTIPDDLVATQGPAPEVGTLVFFQGTDDTDNELALVTGLSGGLNLDRGVLDTVPRAWPVGTPIWYLTTSARVAESTQRADAEAITYKLLPITSTGILDLSLATELDITMSARPHLPFRPANAQINGTGFGTVDCEAVDPIPATWANRNRLSEDAVILGWTDADVPGEDTQVTRITILDPIDRSVVTTHDDLTGTSFDIPHTSFGGLPLGIVRFESKVGTDISLQGHEITVKVADVSMDGDWVTFDSATVTMDAG